MIAKQKIHGFTAAFDYNHKKMQHKNQKDRAVLLDHNFFKYDRTSIMKELSFLQQLRPNLKRNAYHVSLNFAGTDRLSTNQLSAIGKKYLSGMGFNDNSYAIWQHFDADHLHIHVLASRIKYDGSVVSDSNNFRRSEKLCREIERKYGLEAVISSKEALDRAPNKDELEMIQRTGELSERILVQEKLKLALSKSIDLNDFILNCEKQGVYLLFNQSKTTGHISGITYISSSNFIINASKLGNQYKFSNIKDQLNYEQGANRQTIGETNDRTRTRFKELLERGSRGNENRHSRTVRTPTGNFEKSARLESKDESIFENRKESRFESDSARIDRHEEPEQEVEESFSIGIFASASAIISGVAGMLGSISPGPVNEDEKRRKRKIKR